MARTWSEHIVQYGRTGEWCDRCLLPSVIKFDMIVKGTTRKVATFTQCLDCGWNPAYEEQK